MTLLLFLLGVAVLLLVACCVTLIMFLVAVWRIYNRMVDNAVLPPFEESPWREAPKTFG